MKLYELCNAAGLSCDLAGVTEINKIKSNSEKVEKGDLFVCVKGLHKDGHEFAVEAEKRGAAAVIAEHEVDVKIPVVYTENARKILPLLYNAWYGYPTSKLKLVAVTGTNGKTSVTHMLKAIFDAAMFKTGLIGTVKCYSGERLLESIGGNPLANMTTPDPEELFRLLSVMADDGVEYVFMEASSHALALDKLEGLEFEAAVFTNLTPEHMDFHKDMEDYFKAKSRLFEKAKKKIINTDDVYGKRLFRSCDKDVRGCSVTRKCCDFFADDINDMGVEGNEYRFVSPTKQFLIRTPLIGRFNVMNTLEAAACATALGVSSSDIMCALSSMNGVEGRLERVRLGAITDYSVFIDYAHTPDALYNLLETLCGIRKCDERIVLLFGCGGDRDKSKRRKMGEIAARHADFTIVTSDNSRSEDPADIICEIVTGLGKAEYTVIENRAEAIEFAIKEAKRGDIIIFAGKGHEEYEIDKNGKHPFSEKKIAAEAARKYYLKKS